MARRPLAPLRAFALLVLGAALVATAAPAAAHPDAEVAAGEHRLAPGQSLTFPARVHYHRLVGHVEVLEPAGAVSVEVAWPDGTRQVVAAPGGSQAVNALLACCKGQGWTDAAIVVRGEGAAPVTARLRLALLHDGLAVANDDAETGAAASMVVLPGLAAAVALQRWRQPGDPLATSRRTAAGAFAAMWALALGLGLAGMLRYGGGPVVGSLAATADLPWTGNPILTTHSLLTLLLLLLWGVALVAWARAASRAPDDKALLALGIALSGSALLMSAAWAVEYGTFAVPALAALATATPPLAGIAWNLRKAAAWRRHGVPEAEGR